MSWASQPVGPTEDDGPVDRLTKAAAAASSAGEWEVVKVVLEELRALRLAAAGNVVEMDAKRRGRR